MRVAYFSMADIQSVWENGGQNAYFAEAEAPKNPPLPAGSPVLATSKRGKKYFRRAAQATGRAGRGILVGTADMAGKGIKTGGQYVANAGGYVRDRAKELGGVIRKNPRTAGAVILGGTALGVGGGVMAYRNRNDR